MEVLLIYLIVLLSVAILAFAGFWFYRAAGERKQNVMPQIAPEIGHRAIPGNVSDCAVRGARNRNQ